MAEIFFTIFLFIAITGLTAVLFGGWVIFGIIRLTYRAISGTIGMANHARPIRMNGVTMRSCVNPRCKGANPATASFCRRCGQHLPEAQRVAVRRAAMW